MPLFIKDNQKVMFIHIPKTAGTSIEDAFESADWKMEFFHSPNRGGGPDKKPCNPQHWHQPLLKKWLYSEHDVTFEFVVVRNPFTRLISEMMWKDGGIVKHVKDAGYDKNFYQKLNNWAVSAMKNHISNNDQYLKDTEQFINNNRGFFADNHLRPQAEFVRPISKIYKYEEINQQLVPDLLNKFKTAELGSKFTNLDRSKTRPTTMLDPTDEFKTLYTQLYKQDHDKFGYPMPF